MKNIIVKCIYFYKFYISPYMIHRCRFYPSCSSYSLLSIKKYGSIRGCMYFFKRIVKCNCFFFGGYDPVP